MAIRKRPWTAPNGTERHAWQVTYRDQAGKRKSKQFARKKEAEAFELKAKGEVATGIHTPDSDSITIQRAAELWLAYVRTIKDDKGRKREPTTIAAYDQQVRLHIVPQCGSVKLSRLTAPMVQGYLDFWMLHLSRPMAVRVLRALKAILNYAQVRGMVAQNVALAVKPEKHARQRDEAEPPPKAALRAILKAAQGSNDVMGGPLVTLAIYSGMRASEIRGLAWDGLDLKRGTVTIKQRADASGDIGPPKSKAGHRTIPLPAGAVSALKRWKLACPTHELDLVFPSPKGRALSHRVMMKNYVEPILANAGIEPGGMHAFRHAAASLWIEHGLNAKRVQALMGHGSIAVTFDTYGHLFEQAEQDAQDADAIEKALIGG